MICFSVFCCPKFPFCINCIEVFCMGRFDRSKKKLDLFQKTLDLFQKRLDFFFTKSWFFNDRSVGCSDALCSIWFGGLNLWSEFITKNWNNHIL